MCRITSHQLFTWIRMCMLVCLTTKPSRQFKARHFLSCDKTVTMMKHAKCYRRLGKSFRQEYFSVMNPSRFVKKLKKGEFE
ncbi:MAG: hypothetical protein GY950_17205 [bacterium]|nr:hypothetical protein [bacterium]